nr:hypothetical protein [Treponema socranskii]
MKLGFVSSILADWDFKGTIDVASELGFSCVELACWPQGKAERRYGGVSHIDTEGLTKERAAEILDCCRQKRYRCRRSRTIRIRWTAMRQSAKRRSSTCTALSKRAVLFRSVW